ncbi:hypothetical protein ABZ554_41605, partial [Streptomyces sp. NPDC020125]|uniref:hypothetical protein n=1 Tax=Streptomyces sp. NPDC020125 TaxID=3154593 RepID=UPI0033E0ED3F
HRGQQGAHPDAVAVLPGPPLPFAEALVDRLDRRTGALAPALVSPAITAAGTGTPVRAVRPPMTRPMTSAVSRTTVV